MADRFEADLEAMFAEPPALADHAAFERSVDQVLSRRLLVRRAALFAAGAAGAAVAISQLGGLSDLHIAMPEVLAPGLWALAEGTTNAGLALWMAAAVAAAAYFTSRSEV
jgi:hypothetical protein